MECLKYDAVVIGGGFFGCKISLYLKKHLSHVLILEEESNILQRASYANQARVHNGYHYPRSILTALRSRINFPQFVNEYSECINSTFDKYYAIGKTFSKVNSNQFKIFCRKIGAPIEPAPREVKKLFNDTLIEEVFRTQEYVFDAVKLRKKVLNEIDQAGVEIKFNSKAIQVRETVKSEIDVVFKSEQSLYNQVTAKYVFNCTYSAINEILMASNLPIIPLKHESAEMALVEVPEPLKHLGVTVMCGPFFSLMPFPARDLHTLSHVRYTPHCYWQDTENSYLQTRENFGKMVCKTNYPHMIRDAARYIPILKDCYYVDSIWEVKTVLPQSEVDDSRPILFKRDQGLKNLICVLGAKIDNVYDIPQELQFISNEGRNSN